MTRPIILLESLYRITNNNIYLFRFTVEEMLAEIYCTDDDGIERLLCVVPPNQTYDTDIDSDKSDDEHVGNLNHLGRNMLLSECEVQTDCKFDEPVLSVNTPMSNVNTVHNPSLSVNSLHSHKYNVLTETKCRPTSMNLQPSTNSCIADFNGSSNISSKVKSKHNYKIK